MYHALKTSDFDYTLPPGLIAQTPVEPRDAARLLVVHRQTGSIEHHIFRDLERFLRPGDLLVANDSRVLPARLFGRKIPTGGRVELLLLAQRDALTWEALVGGRQVKLGTRVELGPRALLPLPVTAEVLEVLDSGARLVRFSQAIEPLLDQVGEMPLPPYIHTPLADPERYQTVYSRITGSAAAPTAGLHFTVPLIARLQDMGVGFAFITLHIGLDTFRPVEAEDVQQHAMHSEWVELPVETAAAVNHTRASGGRIFAVGTTAVRALESAALVAEGIDVSWQQDFTQLVPRCGPLAPFSGRTRLFIVPGYQFRMVDALITNFHLPRSTLLMLVTAFAGQDMVRRAYQEAIQHHYRFYSFGDATLVL